MNKSLKVLFGAYRSYMGTCLTVSIKGKLFGWCSLACYIAAVVVIAMLPPQTSLVAFVIMNMGTWFLVFHVLAFSSWLSDERQSLINNGKRAADAEPPPSPK